jgi:hypothetical protein
MVNRMTMIGDRIEAAAEETGRLLFGKTTRWLYAAGCSDITEATGHLWAENDRVRRAVVCIRIECTGQHMLLVAS